MVKTVNVQLEDDKHAEFRRVKDAHGLTWDDVLEHGIEALSEDSVADDQPSPEAED